MRSLFLLLILVVGCTSNKTEPVPDLLLPTLKSQLKAQNDSLDIVRPLVIMYANFYINDINNKMKHDSMEYWSAVQKGLLDNIAAIKYSIDSLNRKQ